MYRQSLWQWQDGGTNKDLLFAIIAIELKKRALKNLKKANR